MLLTCAHTTVIHRKKMEDCQQQDAAGRTVLIVCMYVVGDPVVVMHTKLVCHHGNQQEF